MRLLQNGRRAARLQRQERRVLPQVMLPSQSIYVWLQAERPSLAQLANPVLSLSKHAWSPRPALRQAQGEVVVALALRRHRESVFSLVGITCSSALLPNEDRSPETCGAQHDASCARSAHLLYD